MKERLLMNGTEGVIPVLARPRTRRARMPIKKTLSLGLTMLVGVLIGVITVDRGRAQIGSAAQTQSKKTRDTNFDARISDNSERMMEEGRNTFRFDTFGNEAFWGDALKLHQVIQGAKIGRAH